MRRAAVVVAAFAAGLLAPRRRQTADAVDQDLLALAADTLRTERDFAERFNVRGAALIGFSAVLLGLVVNVGTATFARLSPGKDPQVAPLDLGALGEPLFLSCFLASVLLLVGCAVVATSAVLPGETRRLKVAAWRSFADDRVPIADVRQRVYRNTINALERQRMDNERKSSRLKIAGGCFVLAILFLAVAACTLAIIQLGA